MIDMKAVGKERRNGFGVGVLSTLLILALVSGVVWVGFRKDADIPNASSCALGGYGDWAYFGEDTETPICIGVVDGEWQIEPLDDVRARLEGE